MKKNTKIAIASGGAFLVILFGIVPGLLGGPIESAVRAQFEGPRISPLFDARLVEYERGWFSSRAKVALDIAPIKAALRNSHRRGGHGAFLDDELELNVDLIHGPVIRTGGKLYWGLAGTSHTFDPLEAMAIADKLPPEMLAAQLVLPQVGLKTSVVFSFGGATKIAQEFPAFEFTLPIEKSPVNIDWNGYYFDAVYDASAGTFVFRADMPLLEAVVAQEGVKVEFRGLSAAGEMSADRDYLWTGDSEMRLDLMSVDVPESGGKVVHLENLFVSSGIDWQDEALLHSGTVIEIDAFNVNEGRGSDVVVNDARFEIDLRNISASALEGYYTLMTQAILSGNMGGERPVPNAALADAAHAVAREFLAAGIEVNVPEFRITLPQGNLAYHHELAIDPEMSVGIDRPQDERILRHVNYVGDVRMDEEIAKLIARSHLRDQLGGRADQLDDEQLDIGILNTLTQFESMGYLEKENGSYHAGITLSGGELSLNGVSVWQAPEGTQ